MKKIFKISTFLFLLTSVIFIFSCNKQETAINTIPPVTNQGTDLQDANRRADAGGIMVYNHFKYNLLNKKYDNYFWQPKEKKQAIDAEVQKFADLTKGYEVEQRFDKLVEQKKLTTSESSFLKKFLHGLEANAEDSAASWSFAQSQQAQLIASSNFTNDEKIRLLNFSSLAKFYAKNVIENHVLQTSRDLSKAKLRDICISGHQLFCSIGNGLVSAAITYGGSFISGPFAEAITAFVSSITGAPFGSCACDVTTTCGGNIQYSFYLDGTCSLSQGVFVGGANDQGIGYSAINTNATPNVISITNGYFALTQSSSSPFGCQVATNCTVPSQAILQFTGNFYDMIHVPSSPTFIQGNNAPVSGTIEIYYVIGNVNKPGSSIVATVNGSIGQVLGAVVGQEGYAVKVQWFRSGWGSLDMQTQTACGELSSKVTLQIKVQ